MRWADNCLPINKRLMLEKLFYSILFNSCADDTQTADNIGRSESDIDLTRNVVKVDPVVALGISNYTLCTKNCAKAVCI